MLQDLLQGFKELIFPDNCLLCRNFLNSRHQKQLCPSCYDQIKLNHPPFCQHCPRPNPRFKHHANCGACSSHPFTFDHAWSATLYNEAMQKLLHRFKYDGKTSLQKLFSPLLKQFCERHQLLMKDYDGVLSIPLHNSRQRERGYNQSLLLSRQLAQDFDLPSLENILIRSTATISQTSLEAKQRWTNVERAFRIKHSSSIKGKKLLLIDDLFTTGATLNAASLTLKESGAKHIDVLTLAVTI